MGTHLPNRRRFALILLSISAAALALVAVAGPVALAKPPATPPVALSVTGLTASPAGTQQTVRVTVLNNGKASPGYRGTVTFSSSDPQAVLPASYRFTSADKGTRTFTVTLRTAGSQTVTVRDTVVTALAATTPAVTVTPAAAASLTLAGLVDAAAGTHQSVTLTARDAYGNVATGYRGTVAVTSSDPGATLPADTAFSAADAGVRAFPVTLVTAGSSQSVTATDVATSALTATASASVTAGPAVDLELSTDIAGPLFQGKSVATAGQPFGLTIRAIDAFGNTAAGYVGSVELKATDGDAALVPGQTGSATVELTTADRGVRTLPDVTLFQKRIYSDDSVVVATDAATPGLSDKVLVQVLPGPAVSYSECPDALSQSSGYVDPNAPIGVNDPVGLRFTALDAYGNDATNRQTIGLDVLPKGYEADAIVETSDDQAAFGPLGAKARFSGSPFFAGPQLELRLRTAGTQTITITDPDDPSLTRTCGYEVLGPIAFRGSFTMADPFSSGFDVTPLRVSMYLPPNAGPIDLVDVAAPTVDGPGDPASFGSISFGSGLTPGLTLDWDPDSAPAGTVTCPTTDPCPVTALTPITFKLVDQWGNESAGSIAITPFTSAPFPPKLVLHPQTGGVLIGQEFLLPQVSNSASVAWSNQDTTGIKLDDSGGVIVTSTPTGAQLTLGGPVQVRVMETRDPSISGCVPTTEESCENAGFADVEIIYGGPFVPGPDYTTINGARTTGYETCAFFNPEDEACAALGFTVDLPGPGTVGQPYSFQMGAVLGDPLDTPAFSVLIGSPPPGLTLDPNGLLHGTPTQTGLSTFTVMLYGDHSGVSRTAIFTIHISAP